VEIYKDVFQIQSLYGGRNLFQYLFVGENVVLLDTGITDTPEKTIFPYMDKLGLTPEQLTLAVITHPDVDHQGGNDAVKRAAPRTWLACGVADKDLVEDPRALYDLRYNFLQADHDLGFGELLFADAGKPRTMDICFSGGEKIRLRDDWELEVLHVPGHSHGHLALYDAKHKAAFIGDAIHGRGSPNAQGGMGLPVTYYQVDVYLSTLRYFEVLPIDVLYSAHCPTLRGEQIRDFIAESRQTVALFDRVILSDLAQNPAGLSLQALIAGVAEAMGDWPRDTWFAAMFSVKGHLDRLEERGQVCALRGTRPVKWVRT